MPWSSSSSIALLMRRVHGAHRVVEEVGPDMLVLVDAGIASGGFFEHVRACRAHVLGALEAGAWEHLPRQRRLADGSVRAWVPPTRGVQYPMQRGMWVRLISYRVTDERLGELALLLEPEEATEPRLRQMRQQMAQGILPPRRLRVNRREVKQVYNKYKPKKRHLPPPVPFEPQEQFLDFVVVLDSLASLAAAEGGT
jgi:hypothetical protein